jgi:hypothetical protein
MGAPLLTELSASEFARNWTAEVLKAPPLIAPARQYTWPRQIVGEEDALARGALRVMVRVREQAGNVDAIERPAIGGSYLLTCALGFIDPAMPSGVWSAPDPNEICVVAGGYAYLAPVTEPERCTHLELRPVVAVYPAVEAGLLLFVGFQTIAAWSRGGMAWETGRLSWEGVRVTEVSGNMLRGLGWDLMSDQEMEFVVDLRTGQHRGGGWSRT